MSASSWRIWRRHPVGLRRRILLIFTFGAFALSTFLAFTTYGLVRSNLVAQRENVALDNAYHNYSQVQRALQSGLSNATSLLDNTLNVRQYAIFYDGEWTSITNGFGEESIPDALRETVIDDGQPALMTSRVDDEIGVTVGINLPDLSGGYFEFASMQDADDTLSNVALSLFLAAIITTGLGVVAGVLAARRAVRPVADASAAAKAIAGGHLDTRLEPTDDADLGVLAQSFNEMADTLQQRIERDARFASDVSHELRSPLMTLSASVEVMQARRDELPPRAQAALDLLVSDVTRFRGLVEDLLEISRFDAGAVALNLEQLDASQFVRNAVAVSSAPGVVAGCTPRAERAVIAGDRRRLARVIANLIDNALAYGSAEPEIRLEDVTADDGTMLYLRVAVEDHGPGVPVEERSLIFERFARGAAAGARAGADGAGLGLALVDEHVRLHDGRVWVEERSDGRPGARFVIELPARDIADQSDRSDHRDHGGDADQSDGSDRSDHRDGGADEPTDATPPQRPAAGDHNAAIDAATAAERRP